MRNIIFLIVTALYLGMNYYIVRRIIQGLRLTLPTPILIIIAGLVLLLAGMTLATYLLSDQNVGGLIGKIGTWWLGMSMVAFVFLAIAHFIITILSKFPPTFSTVSQWTTTVTILVMIAFMSYGMYHAADIQTKNYKIEVKKAAPVDSLKIVLISDVHLGYFNDATMLEKLVTKINNQQPDIILIAGDLFDGNFKAVQAPEKVIKELTQLTAKYGTFMCWGNHDAGENFNQMKQAIQQTNMTLLEDEVKVVAGKFAVAGRKDLSPIGNQGRTRQSINQQIDNIPASLPVIVLDHQPAKIDEYTKNVDLIVSGHTHKGQVFPFGLITQAIFTVDYGYYQKENGTQVIVSSGAGSWGPPIRVGTDSEIVCINMDFLK